VLGVEELRALKGFQYTATLLDLERLRFVGTCCLRLLRVYICEIFPISGRVTKMHMHKRAHICCRHGSILEHRHTHTKIQVDAKDFNT
jgi:hypothetical protein